MRYNRVNLQENLLDELTIINEGNHNFAYRILGCKESFEYGVDGFRFTVWAPRAKRVGLVGDFNNWEFEAMEPVFESGFWSIFKGDVYENQKYKYAIETTDGKINYKIDPVGHKHEVPPKDASVIVRADDFHWNDYEWMEKRKYRDVKKDPVNIYEVHTTSWKKHYDGRNYSFEELALNLIPYVKEMGYTHIELMPVMDHPLEASWGYQISGYFAVAGRFGDSKGLKRLIDTAHQYGIGVILDWVPGHFCQNYEAIAYYDGTATYEYEHPIKAVNKRWGSLNFDLGKNQVISFLNSSAFYWLHEFHVDGFRVDAVSNMLYLDYDIAPHVLNMDGTNDNRDGIQFLRQLNKKVHETFPGVMMIAEESTAWDGVTRSVDEGGLGFDYKWSLGWMNDTLRFFEIDPLYRPYHFNLITFVFVYLFSERFILPLSHDEVVHGKQSILGRMPGDRYKQFAQLKVLNALMLGLPGHVLNFMGNELGQFLEWRFYDELEWKDLNYEYNKEYQHAIKTMNHIYQEIEAFHNIEQENFKVLQVHDDVCILVLSKFDNFYVLLNFLPIEHREYHMPVHHLGEYEIIFNSELKSYGGSWEYQEPILSSDSNYKLKITVPSYGVLFIKRKG